MNDPISNRAHWHEVFRQQSLINAEHWLNIVEKKRGVASLVATDYENLLRALEIALNDPKFFDLAYRLIRALFSVVYGYGDWERWLVYLEQALAISQQTNNSLEEAFLFEYIGDLLFPTGKLQEAEASFQQAGNQFNNLQRIGDFSRILAKLALIFDLRGETTQGIDLCLHALSLAQGEKNLRGIAHANLTLSHIYGRARKWEEALTSAQKSYDIYQSLQEPEFSNKALMNIAAYWAELGNWDKVHNMSETLMEPLVKIGDIRTLSQLKNNLGVVAFNQGNYKASEIFWQGALQLHTQIQEPTELAGLYNNLGVLYTALGEWTAAEEMLQKAITAYEALGDVYNWANTLDNLADFYEAQGETAVIPPILEEAIAGLQAIDRTPHTQKLLASMQNRLRHLQQNK